MLVISNDEPPELLAALSARPTPYKADKRLSAIVGGEEVGYDFTNTDSIFIGERKVVYRQNGARQYSDLYASIKDGRFDAQIRLHPRWFDGRRILILEGDLEALFRWQFRRKSWIISKLMTAINKGWQIFPTGDINRTAEILYWLDRKIGYEPGFNLEPRGDVRSSICQVEVLKRFESVGNKRACDLLNHFGNLRRIFRATPGELEEVDGIGKKIAAEMIRTIDERIATGDT